MEPIGGYFSLELPLREEYHKYALSLNTGRNCLEYILKARGYKKVYIPYYTCAVILEPFQKLGVTYAFYHIDINLEISEKIILKNDEALLYVNYYGFKQRYVEVLAGQYGERLIVDNTQAFYAKPIAGIDSFYTCRKFFGVPDGAYLYTDKLLDEEIEQDVSYDRVDFLVKRIDLGAETGYTDFQKLTKTLVGQPIKLMSNLTHRLMQSIDYKVSALQRRKNWLYLDKQLNATNQLKFSLSENTIPMVYAYLTDDKELKKRLIAEKVFVATYWPNVFEWCEPNDLEYLLAERTVFIPIDQRYDAKNMKRIIDIICK
ncbi:MAG: hypothetical protein J6P83_00555 [Bacteroidales bacterium]|nr:hypothetical protein [Bacteroidales bacterium]